MLLEDGLVIEVMDHHGIVLVALSGELTAVDRPALLQAVDDVLATSPRNLQLGTKGLTLVDSGGLLALLWVRDRAANAKVPMQLLGPSPMLTRLLQIASLTGVFEIVE